MLTVTTAATDRTLLTLAEIQSATGSTDVATMDTLNAHVSATLARACRLATAGVTPPTFRLETLVDTYRQDCSAEHLILSRRPIVSVVSVVENGITLDSDEYESDPSAGFLYRLDGDDNRLWWPAVKIVVSYTAGWATVPDDLKAAAIKTARILWSEDGPNAPEPGVKRERIDGVGEWERWISPASDPLLDASIMELLGPYIEHRGV